MIPPILRGNPYSRAAMTRHPTDDDGGGGGDSGSSGGGGERACCRANYRENSFMEKKDSGRNVFEINFRGN